MKPFAIILPMPREPPVTRATRPSSENRFFIVGFPDSIDSPDSIYSITQQGIRRCTAPLSAARPGQHLRVARVSSQLCSQPLLCKVAARFLQYLQHPWGGDLAGEIAY